MKEKIGIYISIADWQKVMEENYKIQESLKNYFRTNNSKKRPRKVNVVDIYVDLHITSNAERPEYNRLIKDIFEEKINKILVLSDLCLATNYDIRRKIENTVKVEYLDKEYDKQNSLKEDQLDVLNKLYKKIMFPYTSVILGH